MSHAPVRILLIEDSPEDAAHLRHMLRESLSSTGFELLHRLDGEDLLAQVAQFRPEVIILDYDLPGDNGLDLLKRLREASEGPAIMVTGKGHENVAANALRLGALDYLRKEELNPEELARAIFRVTATASYERARLAAEQRNRYAEAQRDTLFKQMPLPALLLDRHGGVLQINEPGVAAFGWTQAEAVGRHFHELAHRLQPDERHEDPFECPILQLLAQEGNGEAKDQHICRADGSFARGLLHIKSIKAEATRLGHLVTFIPLSDTGPIDRQTRSQSRELRDVLNVISHVVKTPMTPIMLELARLRRHAEDNESERALDVMQRNLKRMQNVFDHALEVVAIRRGDRRIRKVETQVQDLVQTVMQGVAELGNERGVTVTASTEPATAEIDPQSMGEALERLLTAAIGRSSPGRNVQVGLDQDGESVRIRIEDFGPRVDETQVRVLLDPFGFFVDERTSGEHVEAALRFYSAKMHVEANGGRLDIRSDTSTVVTVTLPAKKARPPRPSRARDALQH